MKEREGYHLIEIAHEKSSEILLLKNASYSVGRDASNSIVLDSPLISRQHAILLRTTVSEDAQILYRVVDGNFQGRKSTNGVFVNGKRIKSQVLKHGDIVNFGGEIKSTYYNFFGPPGLKDIAEIRSKLFSTDGHSLDETATVVIDHGDIEESADADLIRLASFPELDPNPVIEFDVNGKITYLNPAAEKTFPELRSQGKDHLILSNLSKDYFADTDHIVRTIEHNNHYFEEIAYYHSASEVIRIFLFDVSRQKQVETELLRKDALLETVAQAANLMLANLNLSESLPETLGLVGQAIDADYMVICRHLSEKADGKSSPGKLTLKPNYEWMSDYGAISINVKFWRNQSYEDLRLSHWYESLLNNHPVLADMTTASATDQAFLQLSGIHSLFLLPLQVGDRCWGFLGIADCRHARQWSPQETMTGTTIAASIAGSLYRQQVEDQIRFRALHDALTGLPNRVLFDEQLDFCLQNAKRQKFSLAVMFLDLDRFKIINDTLGHAIGDRLLQQVAHRIENAIRAGDIVARWGGDEFILLIPQFNDVADLEQIATRILDSLESAFIINTHELYITTSIGIAILEREEVSAETLIKQADIALYQVKDQGRNAYQIYHPDMDSRGPEILRLEKDLRQALTNQEIVLVYQPRVNLLTRQIDGMEALVRWHHPEMGIISPVKFIPLAEENGLIIPLGEWILLQACQQNKQWQTQGFPPIRMAVNLSPKQFRQPNLLQKIQSILARTGLEPRYLELEITETAAVQNMDFTREVFQQLETMGVHLSIDDFGTGHSSLSRLQSLPLHHLKIDKSFVQELSVNQKMSHIVATIVALGKNLGLQIIAEGVETQQQLDYLLSIQCESAQGFFFHKPISAESATHLLQQMYLTSQES